MTRGGFWDILKKSVSAVETCLGGRRLAFACTQRPWAGVARDGAGTDEKARIERLCLSPYVKEPLNSKVIKSFVPELRSRYVFFEFRDSYVLCYICMNIPCTFRIFMYMAMVHSYHVYFRANILGKGNNPLFLPVISWVVPGCWYLC